MGKLPTDLAKRLETTIRSNSDDLVQLRRHFHAHPELSHQEFETTRELVERLSALGFETHVRDEGTGLYADLAPDDFDPYEHPTVAIRSDIDALPIEEQNDVPYRSKSEGVMHACGHDVHMASVVGTGMAADAVRNELPGRVRLIFQHAEEQVPGGAGEMVSFGAIDGVDAILGLHCDPSLEVGKVGLREGAFTAGFDNFEITIIGKGGHGARPHQTIDPIYVVTQVANALYQAIGRSMDSRDPATLSIGKIQGGDAPNAIPEQAKIEGTIRTLSDKHQAEIEPMIKRIVGGVCMAHDAKYDLQINYGAPAIYNDPVIVEHLRDVANGLLGEDNIRDIPLPSMGSEDFSVYLQHAPGAMFRLGTAGVGPKHVLHSSKFDVDERAIGLGSYMLSRTALRLLDDLAQSDEPTTEEAVEKAREANRQRKCPPSPAEEASTVEELAN